MGCKKCWTASQKKGFQYFKLTGESRRLPSPSPFPGFSGSAIFSLGLCAEIPPGLSLDTQLLPEPNRSEYPDNPGNTTLSVSLLMFPGTFANF